MSGLHFLVTLGTLFLIQIRILLPILNSHSIEFEPGHTHIVIGAKTVQEAEAALLAHQHGNDPQQTNNPSALSSLPAHSGVRVVSLPSPGAGQVSTRGLDPQAFFVSRVLFMFNPLVFLWQTISHTTIFPEGSLIRPQEQPPELSF
jgi:hypothetical protein